MTVPHLPGKSARRDRGVALLLVIFALMMVSAIGLGMMTQTDTESAINSNFRDQQLSYYAATAGLEEARDRMRAGNITLPVLKPGAGGAGGAYGVTYIINPKSGETVAPWTAGSAYVDEEICKEALLQCSGSSLPSAASWYTSLNADPSYSASSLGIEYKWTRLTLKLNRSAIGGPANTAPLLVDGNSSNADNYVCWNGTNEVSQSSTCSSTNYKDVYHLTSLAVTSNGSRRMLQYELTQNSLDLGFDFPGALSLIGPSVSSSFPNSNNFRIDGRNHTSCDGSSGTTTGGLPAIAVQNSTADASVTAAIPRADHYTGTGSTPDVEVASIPSVFQSPSSIEALLTSLKGKAPHVYGSNPSGIALGSSASPQFDFVDGDLTLSSSRGYGVLVVTGTLTLSGNFGWQGAILVLGKGALVASGGGNGEFDGAILVAKSRDDSGNVLSSLGTPTFNWSGGGGNGLYYSSACFTPSNTPPVTDYKIISSRELIY